MRLFQQLSHVQQGFRGDAAAVEADASGGEFGIDQGDGHAQIGGEGCSGVASGAAADYGDVQVWSLRHEALQPQRLSTTKGTKVHEVKPINAMICSLLLIPEPTEEMVVRKLRRSIAGSVRHRRRRSGDDRRKA